MKSSVSDIFKTDPKAKETISKTMSRMSYTINNYAFSANIFWCKFSSAAFDTWNYDLHRHSFFEAHFCIRGTAIFNDKNSKEIKISKKEFVIFPQKFSHRLINVSSDFEKLVIGFDLNFKDSPECEFLKNAFSEEKLKIKTNKSSFECTNIINSILKNAYSKKNVNKLLLCGYIELLIAETADIIYKYNKSDIPAIQSNDPRIDYLILYMKDNIKSNLKAVDFESLINLSIKHINRLMRQNYQMTAIEYFKFLRIQKIKDLLVNSDFSLQEIAEKLNFPDEFIMAKMFKQNAGISPGKYRINYSDSKIL